MVNLLAGVMLGPWYATAAAIATSVIRNVTGTGTIFAFPGSIFGAQCEVSNTDVTIASGVFGLSQALCAMANSML